MLNVTLRAGREATGGEQRSRFVGDLRRLPPASWDAAISRSHVQVTDLISRALGEPDAIDPNEIPTIFANAKLLNVLS